MIWLAWRQFRVPAVATGALLTLLLLGLLLTWSPLSALARSTGMTGCAATSCAEASTAFGALVQRQAAWQLAFLVTGAMLLLPAMIGMFWGAPLVAREMETGTFRMVFSQSVGRGRWLLVKVLVGAGATALGAALLGLILTWWAAPIDTILGGRMSPVLFSARGVVPIGYTALAFVAGMTAGLLLRRTVAAMAVALFVIGALQVAVPSLVRPHLAQQSAVVSALDAEHVVDLDYRLTTGVLTVAGSTDSAPRGAWIIGNRTITPDGNEYTGPDDPAQCRQGYGGSFQKCRQWLARQHLRQELTYLPDTTFWTCSGGSSAC